MNGPQVKKALFCRGLAFRKGDSRWPSSQERCGSIRFLARLARKPGQEGEGMREADWFGGGACKTPQGSSLAPPISCLELKGMTSPRLRALAYQGFISGSGKLAPAGLKDFLSRRTTILPLVMNPFRLHGSLLWGLGDGIQAWGSFLRPD